MSQQKQSSGADDRKKHKSQKKSKKKDLQKRPAVHRNLVAPIPGDVTCLRCMRKFHSPDRRRVRTCNRCRLKSDPYVKNEVSTFHLSNSSKELQ